MIQGYDFFVEFDADIDVKKKEELMDVIRAAALEIYEDTVVIIKSIGSKYEHE